jgi:hypothetical protein
MNERDRIDGMFVSGDVLVATRLGKQTPYRKKGRCKHDAPDIRAPRQQRGGGVTALAVSGKMEPGVPMPSFDGVERR